MAGGPRLHCANGHTPPPDKEGSKFCTICGAQMLATCPNGHEVKPAHYCSVCGASFSAVDPRLPTDEDRWEPPISTTGPQKPRRAPQVFLIIGAIILAVFVGVGAYFGFSRLENSSSSPQPALSTEPSVNSQPPSTLSDGEVPQSYLGSWDSSIDSTTGHHTRRLVIQQGDVGDPVLSLVADGPTKNGGTYHCVYTAELASTTAGNGPLHFGPSTATVAEPASACKPHGTASTVTLLPDGRLQRRGSEDLIYTKSG